MRGDDVFQDELFSYGGLGERVPAQHPLRRIREFADAAPVQSTAGRSSSTDPRTQTTSSPEQHPPTLESDATDAAPEHVRSTRHT